MGVQGLENQAMNDTTKTVLITGASGGIGYELAKLFAKDHHNLILVAAAGSGWGSLLTNFSAGLEYG
jgi:NAD(P)-dependent dehydrogenase (short-subunit alcohol dehydrogenase family)